MMKRLFFYGDSNTWGYDPRDGSRYPADIRWTGLLSDALKDYCEIVSDGLNGRCVPEPAFYVERTLENAGRIDLFTVMLGTNDLWWPMHPDAAGTAEKMRRFLRMVKEICKCRILLIAPPILEENQFWFEAGDGESIFSTETRSGRSEEPAEPSAAQIRESPFAAQIRERREQSLLLTQRYKKLAEEEECFFADSSRWKIGLAFDGVHFSEEGHRTFASEIQKIITQILVMTRESAVLVPLAETPEGLSFLMEVRSMNVMQPGEICFPGGGIEDGETAAQAAVRETEEELGIAAEQIEILSELPEDRIRSRRVHAVLAKISSYDPEKLILAENEVSEVFTLPLAWLKNHEPAEYDLHDPYSPDLPDKLRNYLRNYDLEGRGAKTYYWEYKNHGIWGLSARILVKTLKEIDGLDDLAVPEDLKRARRTSSFD